MIQAHVMIAGAGPVGLVSALVLAEAGVRVTVAESSPGLNEDFRASTFHPPTLDMLAPYGLTQDLISQGLVARYTQQRDRHEGVVAEFDMQLLSGDTDHPFRLQCEQWKLTNLILAKLEKIPHVQIHFNAKVESVEQTADKAITHLTIEEQAHQVVSNYVLAADGAWSTVRRSLGIDFDGLTYPERFLVISTEFEYAKHLPKLSYVNYCSDPKEWCVLLRVPTLWRVLFPTKPEETDEEVMGDVLVEQRLQALLPQPKSYETVHRSLYKVHQRVAKTFRQGRVFLLGDAGHINNPLGGMGMNGGVHDAMNLCKKLLAVIQKGQSEDTLDRYERQRRTIAIEYINASTARNKKEIEERDPVLRKKTQDELRAICANPVKAKAYLRKTSMLDALERADSIA